ncbi:MAG: phosphate acyltransferase PlsX [Cytophagales bacterium]|nr:phosphate acyltransferase PlsX [Cytophagales bacterium]
MRIALDAMGGDYAPRSIIEGALLATAELPEGAKIILVGQEDVIKQHLQDLNGESNTAIQIVNAPSVIEMAEHPTKAISQKQDSSIVIGYSLLKAGKVDAFCSAGNTGAMLVGAMFTIKAIEGVARPGIAGFFPKEHGRYGIVLDVGANADCKPEVLNQFAELGSVYYKHIFNIENPKVGLLNLGEEESKGNSLTKEAHGLLKANESINFVGNIEGRDLFDDSADVVVCDGFTGNVILKMGETFYGLLEKRGFTDNFIDMFNYASVGGSPILGVNGNVIIGHGVSSPEAIKNMMGLATQTIQSNISEKIKSFYK